MITVERRTDLEVQTWAFNYDERGNELYLQWWKSEQRETKRHKFRPAAKWDRVSSQYRKATPADVLAEARRRFVDSLKVEGEPAAPVRDPGPMPPDFAHDPDGSIRAAWDAEQVKRGWKR